MTRSAFIEEGASKYLHIGRSSVVSPWWNEDQSNIDIGVYEARISPESATLATFGMNEASATIAAGLYCNQNDITTRRDDWMIDKLVMSGIPSTTQRARLSAR